jgi:hypothetical protein
MPMSTKFREDRYKELQAVARKHGGKLLARSYSFLRTPMPVQCANGHRFKITPKNILRGLWCSECRPLPRQSEFLAVAAKVAKSHGGKVLSTTYENARLPLRWQCAKKHRWEASLDNVANKKSWCPTCSTESASERKTAWWRKQARKRR